MSFFGDFAKQLQNTFSIKKTKNQQQQQQQKL